MAFETLKQSIKDVFGLLKKYVQSNVDYYKLKALKKIVKISGKAYTIVVLLLLLPLVLFFGSIAGAIWIGNYFNNYVIGFAIVSAFYLVIMLLAFILGGVLVKRPVLRKLSRKMFKEKE